MLGMHNNLVLEANEDHLILTETCSVLVSGENQREAPLEEFFVMGVEKTYSFNRKITVVPILYSAIEIIHHPFWVDAPVPENY